LKTVLAILSILFLAGTTRAQNLIPNPSFEDENICTEYRKNCAPEAWIATSLYANYYFDATMEKAVPAQHGTHYIGLTAGNIDRPGMRNFIRSRLLCGMQKDHQYQLEFYIRANNNILDSIGIYFSATDYLYDKRYFKAIKPQLWSTDVRDKNIAPTTWQKIRFIYTAGGTEGFITIGNFKRDDYTGIRKGELRFDYYFFIDSVSLTPINPKETLCAGADSVARAIYEENERHNYLERKVYYMRRNPPAYLPLPKTKEPVVQRIDTLIIPDIFFATASYELTTASFTVLDSFANKLTTLQVDSMIVEGHTDSIGKLAYNEALSQNRANYVSNYLSAKVVGLSIKTVTRGFAYLRPVASNKTPKGRQQNRRVEIFVYRRE
jgi:outer membrane protein OmpA-like peptidoglycan-associated protein